MKALLLCLAAWWLGGAVGPGAAAAGYSRYWGKQGEAWKPSGPLTDFSFAGYRFGNANLPNPPVTKWVNKAAGMTDTDALLAAVAWANKQPIRENQYTVIGIPAGNYTLTKPLKITKPWVVLRGAGAGKTIFSIPKPLMQAVGWNPQDRIGGYYINNGGFVEVDGKHNGVPLTFVSSTTPRGARTLTVVDATKVKKGMVVFLHLNDRWGSFIRTLYANDPQYKTSTKLENHTILRFASRVQSVNLQTKEVTLERSLPWPVRPEFGPRLFLRRSTVYEVGIEGISFYFAHSIYNGHHKEVGYNAIYHNACFDCWAKDIETVNADNSFLADLSNSVTITDFHIRVTKSRKGIEEADGHWGAHHGTSSDFLVQNFRIDCVLLHHVGAGGWGMLSVYQKGVMADGNMESHRNLAGQLLFTDLDVGKGSKAFFNSGPSTTSPNTQAYSTYWNIRADKPLLPPWNNVDSRPGTCAFGPALNFMGVNFDKSYKLCPSWISEPGATLPGNLYEAQLAKRLGRR